MRITKALAGIFISSAITYAQVTLQPWVQVYGTVPGSKLGLFVNGHVPSANFPYRASVFQSGNTGVYTVQDQNDTAVERIFLGENLKTGDLNGDGWTDVVVRHKSRDTSYVDTVVIYWGTAVGNDTANATRLTGSNVREGFGSVCMGDVVGDSTDDLIVGAAEYPGIGIIQGRVYIYTGGSAFDTVAAVILNGDSARYGLGFACCVGDVNNDGYNDLFVRGVHQTTPRFNYVDIWIGGVSFDTTRDIRLSGPETATGLACFDANGDGVSDLLWANRDSLDWVYVHYGGTMLDTVPSLRLEDPQFALFGTSIINAGDMNGDGFNEIAVASPFSITSGFVIVYGGGPQIDQYFDAAVGMSGDSEFGRSIASVGDVSGDGLSDIIVGAPNYEFGNDKGYWGIFKGDSTIRVTEVIEDRTLPIIFKLHQCYPNPFNPRTLIKYDLIESGQVTLEVFTTLGQSVTKLVDEHQFPGAHEVIFDGTRQASGVYFYRLTARTDRGHFHTDTKKLVLVK